MIYTASFFEKHNHHGTVVSISRKTPSSYKGSPNLEFLAPSSKLVKWWKNSDKTELTWQEYRKKYWEEIKKNGDQVELWLSDLSFMEDEDITLLCWEFKGEYCHRNEIGKLIQKRLPKLWGGADKPVTRIEEFLELCRAKGISVKCNTFHYPNGYDSYYLYNVIYNGKDLGLRTRMGTENLLCQIINPTYPEQYFRQIGLKKNELK